MIGGCDLYTTKAAGTDKKLYRTIETSLETQHETLLRLSASLSPPQADALAPSLNLSRSSPFGPLSQISSRRTFAYLIATLNASHPDYDFSHILRPSEFRRERSLRSAMQTLDTTLYNLRPRPSAHLLAHSMPSYNYLISASGGGNGHSGAHTSHAHTPLSSFTSLIPAGLRTPGGSLAWGPRMWRLIDAQMALRECAIYAYQPEDDPFAEDDDEGGGALWSTHYFFFNKERKRVCYLHLRAVSLLSRSPRLQAARPLKIPIRPAPSHPPARASAPAGVIDAAGSVDAKKRMARRRRQQRRTASHQGRKIAGDSTGGAGKRARYWLGDRAANARLVSRNSWEEDDDNDAETVYIAHHPGDDEVDADDDLVYVRSEDDDDGLSNASDEEDEEEGDDDDEEMEVDGTSPKDRTLSADKEEGARGVSESIAESMEV